MAEYGKMRHLYTEVDQAVDMVSDLVPTVVGIRQEVLSLVSDQEIDRNRIIVLESAVAELVDNGAKNLLEVTGVSQTTAGITYTVAGDGTVSASGTATGTSIFTIGQVYLKEGQKLVLSGCPAGGDYYNGYSLFIAKAVTGAYTLAHEEGDSIAFTVPEDALYNVRIVIRPAGYSVDGIVYFPMVCSEAAWGISHKPVPYCPTLPELYAMIQGGGTANSLRQTAQLTVNNTGTETEEETR